MTSKQLTDQLELSLNQREIDSKLMKHRSGIIAKLVAWMAYPVVISLGLVLHEMMLNADCSLLISTYCPVIVAAISIAILEQGFPHRELWWPNRFNLATDTKFMVIVQILLPQLLSFLIAILLLEQLSMHYLTLETYWLHQAPTIVQAILMLLISDFLRYWLHRATHEWVPGLWRLHAVHHAPQKLYWLNVGRFHPIEKILQFILDAFPFLLLHVSAHVLSLYFVFYAINGFFQHSNIELRLGILNIVISGPELHRWHHSTLSKESNKNYGNNLILWDLMFGTYFRPQGRQVQTIGL